jgi:hypothetical protein
MTTAALVRANDFELMSRLNQQTIREKRKIPAMYTPRVSTQRSSTALRAQWKNSYGDLENKLCAKLDRSRISCLSDLSEQGRGNVCAAEISEVDVIENVERLGSKLQLRSFSEANVLQHREVNTERRRAVDDAAPAVSNYIRNVGVHSRVSFETRGVEPLLLRVGSILIGIA